MPHPSQQIRFCTSRDGTRIAYAICGQGPPLFWATTWTHHLDLDWHSPLWRPWLTVLSKHYTVIRHDWRGCGLSDRDNVEFAFDRYVEDLEAVVAGTAIDRFPLVGISSGAIFGAAYAARHPDRLTHLVLIEGQARGRLGTDPSPDQIEALQAWLKVIELGWPNPYFSYGPFFTSLHLSDATAEHREAFHDILHKTTSAANVIKLIGTFARADMRRLLPKIRCPTLVLHSRGDSVIPFDEGRTAAALIPEARFVPLESRNHIVLDAEPAWQQMIAALNEFLPPNPAGATIAVLEELTPREREILEAVALGLNNDAIAVRYNISEKTVRNHVSIIFGKLGVNSRAQAVALARDAGLGQKNSLR